MLWKCTLNKDNIPMVEDIIVKCGRKRVSTMMIVITKASMNME
jgi:hypothetical protein